MTGRQFGSDEKPVHYLPS